MKNAGRDASASIKKISPARLNAVSAIEQILTHKRKLDDVLPLLEESCRDGRDRGLAREIVSGTCRQLGWIDYVIKLYAKNFENFPSVIQRILESSTYQLLFLDRVPAYAVVSDAVELVRYHKGGKLSSAVNGILRNIERNKAEIPIPDRKRDFDTYLSVVHSHPKWFVKRCRQLWPNEEVESFLRYNNERAPLSLRVRKDRKTVFECLLNHEISSKVDERFEDIITVDSSFSPSRDFFDSTEWGIQDGAASLPARLLSDLSNGRIWDACAAPGGKTLQIADLLNKQCKIVATDCSENRLKRLHDRLERLEIACVETRQLDLLKEKPPFESEMFDAILLDVPCSGWGTFRRNPDLRWHLQSRDSYKFGKQAYHFLEKAAPFAAVGGIIVYSTCTLSPEENEQVVEAFLDSHPHFEKQTVTRFLNEPFHKAVTPEGFLRIDPHRWNLDGAFAARLRRTA